MHVYWTRFWLPVSIAIAFTAVAILAAVTYRNTEAIRQGERQVIRSYAIREATRSLMSALKDQQTAERGYIITGRDVFLEPFDYGERQLDSAATQLQELTSDSHVQAANVRRLISLAREKSKYLAGVIAIRREQPSILISEQVVELVNSEIGERMMNSVRDLADEIVERESITLREKEAHSAELTSYSHAAIIIGNMIALALITLSAGLAVLDRGKRDFAESNLEIKQAELSAIVDSTSDAIVAFDEHFHVKLMNPAARGVYQIADDPQEMKLLELFPSSEQSAVTEEVRAMVASSVESRPFAGIALRKEGRAFPFAGKLVRKNLRGMQFNILLFRDLTEVQENEIRRSELAAILDQARDAIVICDLSNTIISWNRGAELLHGITAANAIGRAAPELLFGQEQGIWETGDIVVRKGNVYATELVINHPEKGELILEHRRSLIRNRAEEPTGQLIMQMDVTEQRREEAKQRRSQRLESLGTLAGGVAHDLNNVLTPILMNAKLAKRQGANQERLLDIVIASAERGGKMIKKLLAFAGATAERRIE